MAADGDVTHALTCEGVEVTAEGRRAALYLADHSLPSYEAFLRIKGALPRYDMEAPFRRGGAWKGPEGRPRLTCGVADLAALGLDVGALLGGASDDAAPLFPDQRWVLDLALGHEGFAVFAEAGWGKTAVQLAFAREVARRTQMPVLISAPLNVVPQTIAEHARFWPAGPQVENVRDVPGGVRAWINARVGEGAVGAVNTDAFKKDVDLTGLGGFVLDESSVLKAMAGVTRNNLVRAVQAVRYRLACSATPAPNDLDEYVSHALFVGAIRAHKEFFADYFDADGEGGWHLRPHAREAFFRFMASWSVWMRHPERYGFEARLGGVPTPVFVDVEVEPTREQSEAARDHRKEGSLFLDSVGVVKRSKLAQISRGFLYEKDLSGRTVARAIPSAKPGAVARCVAAHPGERAVVWVTFDEEARLIAEALAAVGRFPVVVDGSTNEADRVAAVASINDGGAVDTLIAKPTTMGFGINLQGASVVVFSGVGDSFEQDYQALRRAFRYGQRRTVHCYYVVTPFERAMLDNCRRKRSDWEAQTEAMELAFVRATEHHRGVAPPASDRTAYALSPADRAALGAITPWSLAA